MTYALLTVSDHPQCVDGTDDPRLAGVDGPAALLDVDSDVADSGALPLGEYISAPCRPLAYREIGGDWREVGFEAADHWVQMGPDLRSRLVADHLATLDGAEFKQATNGGSASIITNNWVYSGQPRIYRVAGALRDFVTVLEQLARA